MARKPSVILTPAEKKEAASKAKDAVKAAKTALAAGEKARKELDKNYATAIKASDKSLAALKKDLTGAEAAFAALNPPKATPSPTASV